MTRERRTVWEDYGSRGYSLEAVGFRHAGVTLDLIFYKGDEVAAVIVRDAPPSEAEWSCIRTAFRAFLLARRASGLYVRLDRAWLSGEGTEVLRDAVSVLD